MLLVELLDVYSLIVLAVVFTHWIRVPKDNFVSRLLEIVTEPILRPIRRLVPTLAGIDFAPLILFAGIRLFRGIFVTSLGWIVS